MKKLLSLTAVMFLAANTAFAYKDTSKGFEIKVPAPTASIHTNNTYGYLENFDYDVHDLEKPVQEQIKLTDAKFITVLTKEEAGNILKTDFSTAYFNEQYEKLQLLKRSDLSLATLPVPVAELSNYSLENNQINSISINELRFGKNNFNFSEIKPVLSGDKIGKYKVITNTYFIKQANIPYIINTSFISADNKLFILSSSNVGKLSKEEKTDEDAYQFKQQKIQELLKVKNAEISDFEEGNIKTAWDNHVRFIKKFKVLDERKIDKKQQYGYVDSFKKAKFSLPDDWLFQEIIVEEEQFKGQIILALPQNDICKLAADNEAYNIALDILDDLSGTEFENKVMDNQQQYKEVLKDTDIKNIAVNITDNLDNVLISANITDKKEDFKDLLANPEESKFLMDVMFEELFGKLAAINNDLFKLNNYNYLVDITQKRGSINLRFNIDLFDKNIYNNNVKFLYNDKNKITAFVYLDKEDDKTYTEVEKQINQWDF